LDPEGEDDVAMKWRRGMIVGWLALSLAASAQAETFEDALDSALVTLGDAKQSQRETSLRIVLTIASQILADDDGVTLLAGRSGSFVASGVFRGDAWEVPARLRTKYVRGTLLASGPSGVLEALSVLRVLALAREELVSEHFSASDARAFLEEALAMNVDLVLSGTAEKNQDEGDEVARARRILRFVAKSLGLERLGDVVAEEIDARCAQRPVDTRPVRALLQAVEDGWPSSSAQRGYEGVVESSPRLARYVAAVSGPSELARRSADPVAYGLELQALDPARLAAEASAFGQLLRETGLVSSHHPVLLRVLCNRNEVLLAAALGLGDAGSAELSTHTERVCRLIEIAISPRYPQAVDGLAQLIERGLLSRRKVVARLERLQTVELCERARERLEADAEATGISPRALLLAGALSVLGRPLGVSQGNNPTCQSVRGISLWSLHEPERLLDRVLEAARYDRLTHSFEGRTIHSNEIPAGRADGALAVDPVSTVLVPHVDRLYAEIMRRVAGRKQDAHRWANPGLYGPWVPNRFAALIEGHSTVVAPEKFVRSLYATYHPDYRRTALVAPNPVGVLTTDERGALVGRHAVSLLRVERDSTGIVRAYFFNPNGEDRQDWGHGIQVSVAGHGEAAGESSLPLEQLAARLYAFHYDAKRRGDPNAVPEDALAPALALARASWGRTTGWPE
jgi:hypothetical protein